MYFRICPRCGANLDPDETCDCIEKEASPLPRERPLTKVSTASVSVQKRVVNIGKGNRNG